MDSSVYETEAARTTSPKQHGQVAMLVTIKQMQLLHAAIGLATETGEFADTVKTHVFYKFELDHFNAKEELGDLCWYIALALDAVGSSFSEVMEGNIAKLKKRYPDGWTPEAAKVRADKAP